MDTNYGDNQSDAGTVESVAPLVMGSLIADDNADDSDQINGDVYYSYEMYDEDDSL